MRRTTILIAVAAALAIPAAALAEDTAPNPASAAVNECRQQKATMGAQSFADLYGTNAHKSNAMGKCVSKTRRSAAAAVANAAKTCTAEQADVGFASSHDGKDFATFYGTSSKGKGKGNAYGSCVSQHAKGTIATETAATVKAAKWCKAARSDAKQFAADYGTRRNAFGKCVSKASKTK